MSNSHDTNQSDDFAELALREGLRGPALSAEAMQRIRSATQKEWRAIAVAPARRRRLALAAAASFVVLASAVSWNVFLAEPASGSGEILGELVRSEAPGVVESRRLRSDILLSAGAALRAGHPLEVRGDALVTLAGGGNLRVTRASTIEVVSADTVKLDRGELYVDIPPGGRRQSQFRGGDTGGRIPACRHAVRRGHHQRPDPSARARG